MRIYHSLDSLHLDPSAVALGTFDGVHIAHQAVIKNMVKHARAHQLLSVVYTFSNHPKELREENPPKRLMTPEQKEKLLASLGVDVLVMVPFDESQLNIPAEDFVEEILLKKINTKHITVGYDFKFGKKAKGCVNLLSKYQDYFTLDVVEPIKNDDLTISSTNIRKFLLAGDVEMANELLGRYYDIHGLVIHGKHMGRKLGYPTINLQTTYEMSVLKPGVYITKTRVNGIEHPSVTNVGFNPTFNQENFNVETYILDFEGDLYGQHVEVLFIKFISPEMKFDSLEDLIKKIDGDVQMARDYFNI